MHERLQLFKGVVGVEEGVGGRVHGGESGNGRREDYYEAKTAPEENLEYCCVHFGEVGWLESWWLRGRERKRMRKDGCRENEDERCW